MKRKKSQLTENEENNMKSVDDNNNNNKNNDNIVKGGNNVTLLKNKKKGSVTYDLKNNVEIGRYGKIQENNETKTDDDQPIGENSLFDNNFEDYTYYTDYTDDPIMSDDISDDYEDGEDEEEESDDRNDDNKYITGINDRYKEIKIEDDVQIRRDVFFFNLLKSVIKKENIRRYVNIYEFLKQNKNGENI